MDLNSGMNFGIMNSLRTGNMILDVLICMAVPTLVRLVMEVHYKQILLAIYQLFFPEKKLEWHIRLIKTVQNPSTYAAPGAERENLDVNDKNMILQKAIRLYIQTMYQNDSRVQDVFLVPAKTVRMESMRTSYGGLVEGFTGSHVQLASYEVTMLPTERIELQLGKVKEELVFQQYIRADEGSKDSGKQYREYVVYEIRSAASDGARELVDNWVQMAYEWYRNQRKAESTAERFMLQAADEDPTTAGTARRPTGVYDASQPQLTSAAGIVYQQYLLSDEKTFDSLFFPEKREFLQLLEDFLGRRGKFAVPGFPKKLGFLLDGPPGCGKTSLIKALATYTKRHIVSIPLEKVRSNQQLMNIMFDLNFPVLGHQDGGHKLKMEEVIFAMEDIDCASRVVYARKGSRRYRWAGQSLGDHHRAPPAPRRGVGSSGAPPGSPALEEALGEEKKQPAANREGGAEEAAGVPPAGAASPDGSAAVAPGSSAGATGAPRPAPARRGDIPPMVAPLVRAWTDPSTSSARYHPELLENHTTPQAIEAITFRAKMAAAAATAAEHQPPPAAWAGEVQKLCVGAQVPLAPLQPKFLAWAEERGVVSWQEMTTLIVENAKELPLKELERKRLVQEAQASLEDTPGLGGGACQAGDDEDDDSEASEEEPQEDPKAAGEALMEIFLGSSGGGGGGVTGQQLHPGGQSGGSRGRGPRSESSTRRNKKTGGSRRKLFNLSGLLNVLDGVVDSPGRILVMTTNHPEKLDPALIRPGRINRRLHLGYLSPEQLCELAEHYLQQTVTEAQRRDAEHLCELRDVTPAWAEQCCAGVDTVYELFAELARG